MSSLRSETRRSRAIGLTIALLAIALLFVATAVSAKKAGNAGGADAELSFTKSSHLSATEQLAQGQRYLDKIKTIVEGIKKLVTRARKDKDIIKLNCVNDKLIQVKGSHKVARDAFKALKLPATQADAGTRNHEFAKLTIAFQKVLVLAQEAEACVGEELGYVGDTDVDTDVDPDIERQGDPTVEPQPPVPVIRPPVASPTT